MKWQDREKRVNDHITNGNWSNAINEAKNLPHTVDPYQQMPAQNMPASAMHQVIDYLNSLPKDYSHNKNKDSFAFEATHSLPADADNELLHKLYHLSPDSHINTKKIIEHPNFKYEGRDKQLKEAQDYHHKYEMQVFPEYFSTLKSYFTGKPERIKDHRGQEGISDPHIIPSLKEHAAEIQKHILKDDNIPKKFVGPNREPHIKAYRGVNGTYGKAIRDKVEFNPNERSVRRKTLNIPTSHATSWSLDPSMAGRFAWSRGKIDGQPDGQGVVLSQWVPVKNVLHSSMHNSVAGFRSKQMDESEIVLGHPEGKMKVSTADMHFQPEPDYSHLTSRKIPVTSDSTPNNYGQLLKPVVKKSETLEKDRGRITFPADPKITNRPDQEVRVLSRPNDGKIASKVFVNRVKSKLESDHGPIPDYFNDDIKSASVPYGKQKRDEGITSWNLHPPVSSASAKGNQSATIEHEGFHNLIANIRGKHGQDEANKYIRHLNSFIPHDIKNNIDSSLAPYGYTDDQMPEERIAQVRDLLHDQGVRSRYKKDLRLDDDQARDHFSKIGQVWKDIFKGVGTYKSEENNFVYEDIKKSTFDWVICPILESTMPKNKDLMSLETIKCEDLQKSIKSKLLPAVTALSMLGSNIGTEQGKSFSQVKANPVSVNNINRDQDMDPDLDHIKQIESSMGKNVKHKDVNYGINAGSSAYGAYGLMPVQILDTVHYDKALKHKHPHLAELNPIADEDKVKNYIKAYPSLESEIVKSHWNRLGKKFEGDTNRMAYAWKNGLTGAMKATDEQVKEHPYVKKFNSLKKLKSLETKMNKAESVVETNRIGTFTGVKNNKEDNSDIIKINYFIKNGQLKDLSNQGHFTHNSFVVGFEKDNSWLIKVDQNHRSSISAVKEGLQSVKEAAFYEAAKLVFGLDVFTPRAVLGEIEFNDERKSCVAIKMYPDVYIQATEYKKENPSGVKSILGKYVNDGILCKLGAMYYILGDLDGHGKNMLVNGIEFKLIDHGSSFANNNMDIKNQDVFIPYFLRELNGVKDSMSEEEKLEKMPKVKDEQVNLDLRHWIFSLDFGKLVSIINDYSLDHAAATRLVAIRELLKKRQDSNVSELVNELWVKSWVKIEKEV